MSIFIVRNEFDEEVTAYTDHQQAEYLAEQLQADTRQQYRVEELIVE
jgi:hypothetical protein